jgi:hypothetical protein
MYSAVASPVVVGLVASTTSRICGTAQQLIDRQILDADPVDRRKRAAKHVVEPVELVRALHGDDVAGLLDHADQALVAALVGADAADRLVGEVEADLAKADFLLDLADRVGQGEAFIFGHSEYVEGEPLRGAAADAGQLRELGDQTFDWW